MLNKATLLSVLLIWCITGIAQNPVLRKQQNLSHWHIAHANYSGITHIDSNLYAVVDDKSFAEGFFLFKIDMNLKTGRIKSVTSSALKHPANPGSRSKFADCEDIVFVPWTNTLLINSESTGTVKEYTMQGELTGRELAIPPHMQLDKQSHNGGFEALACNPDNKTFWLTTENHLKADTLITDANGKTHQQLRIVQFDEHLKPINEWLYMMEAPL